MNNPTLYLVGGIFLILFFCVMTYFFTKTFRALHVVFLFFTFGMAIWFLVMASLSHKTRLHWREQVDRLEKELARIEADTENLLYPPPNGGDSVVDYRLKLNRVMLDRGRVWRGCSVAGVSNGQIQVNTSPAGAADAAPNQLETNDIVFAFVEGDAPAGIAKDADGQPIPIDIKLPMNYLGEFRAMAVTPNSVTLQPVDARLLLPTQTQSINAAAGGGASWSLYEIMPIDNHQIYARNPDAVVKISTDPTIGEDDQGNPVPYRVFGEMDTEVINMLYNPDNFLAEFNRNLQLNQPAQQQAARQILAKVLRDVLRDGGEPLKGDAASSGEVDLPENIFTTVKVESDSGLTVEVDSDSGAGALTANYYDASGRAVVDRLRRAELDFLDEDKGTELKFEKGEDAIFNKEKADELVEQNLVQPGVPRFVRPLIDFSYEFHRMLDRRTRILQDIARVQDEIRKTNESEERSKRQLAFRKTESDKLTTDKAKFVVEQGVATKYAGNLQQKMTRLRSELSALYRSNANLAARLAQRNASLAKEINARTEAAAAAAGADSGD